MVQDRMNRLKKKKLPIQEVPDIEPVVDKKGGKIMNLLQKNFQKIALT